MCSLRRKVTGKKRLSQKRRSKMMTMMMTMMMTRSTTTTNNNNSSRRRSRSRRSSSSSRSPHRLQRWSLLLPCYYYAIIVALFVTTGINSVSAAGGEMAAFTIEQMTPGVSYRQNVCDRYYQFVEGTVELKDALGGMDLNILMSAYEDGYFHYDPITGINPDYPGMAAILMDELARRGNFRWRNSFGISVAPHGNHSWTDLLVWGVETYDMNIDWWAQNVERMNLGVAFLEEWYDSSIILIRRKPEETVSDEINFWNWLKPYDGQVWAVTIATIILSAFVYQWLEYLSNERDGRSLWQWSTENLYKGFLGFTQEYHFEPVTFEGRIFGISMALWALVMTATYTANLASLLVDRSLPPVIISSMEEAVIAKTPICTFEGTNSDTFIKLNMPSAIRVEKKTLEEVYEALRKGECDLAAEVVASWDELQGIRKFNPTCNLERISATVFPNKAGFATKADTGHLCSGLIRDVINLHMTDIISEGFLEDAWEREHRFSLDIDCDAYRPDLDIAAPDGGDPEEDEDGTGTRRRHLLPTPSTDTARIRRNYRTNELGYHVDDQGTSTTSMIRRLKAGGKSASASAALLANSEDGGGSEKLTLEQMIGTFMFHWFLMAIALFIGYFKLFYAKYVIQRKEECCNASSNDTNGKDTNLTKAVTTMTEASNSDGCGGVYNSNQTLPTTELSVNENVESTTMTKVGFAEGFDEENNGRRNNPVGGEAVAATGPEVHEQLRVLQTSQVQMFQNQNQLLEEQRMLKEQIQILVSVVNRQNTQLQGANGSTSKPANDRVTGQPRV